MNVVYNPFKTSQNQSLVPVDRLNDMLLNGIKTGPELALALAFNLISKQDAEVLGPQIQDSQTKDDKATT